MASGFSSTLRAVSIFALMFTVITGNQAQTRPETTNVVPGIRTLTWPATEDSKGSSEILIIEINLAHLALHVVGGTVEDSSQNISFPASLGRLGSLGLVVTSGGYAGLNGGHIQPLGYLKSGGKVIWPAVHHSWLTNALLCSQPSKSEARLFALNDPGAVRFDDCVQIGPILIRNGQPLLAGPPAATPGDSERHYLDKERIQMFVCQPTDNAHIIYIGLTRDKIALAPLLDELPKLTIAKVHPCENAMALTGGVSAGAYVQGKLVAGADDYLLTSALVITSSAADSRETALPQRKQKR